MTILTQYLFQFAVCWFERTKMSMATSRRFVSLRKESSTCSLSEASSSDDGSIGPLPVLKRNKSIAIRRVEREEERKAVKKNKGTFSSCHHPTPLWIPDVESDKKCLIGLTPVPRRSQSLQLPHGSMNHQTCKSLERRASMQPGAAFRGSLSRRPDPPEQMRLLAPLATRRQGRSSVHACSKGEDWEEVKQRQQEPYKQVLRTLSLPACARSDDHSKIRSNTTRESGWMEKHDDFVLTRRSKSITKSMSMVRPNGVDHDVWVERMLLREGKSPQVFFKAVFSKECKSQPPTGAVNVIYMDELVKVQHLGGRRLGNEKATVTPLVKKQSFWGKGKKGKAKSDSHQTPLSKFKSALGLSGVKRH